MIYQWGKNVETRHIRIFELLEKARWIDGVRTYPHLTPEEIWDEVKYLYKENSYLKREKGSIYDLRNDLNTMIRNGGLWMDKEGRYYI